MGKSSVRQMYEDRVARWGVSAEVACGLGIAEHEAVSRQTSVQTELERAIAAVLADPEGTYYREQALDAYRGALEWVKSHGEPSDVWP